MTGTFEIQIVTPETLVFKGNAASAVIPAEDGYLGVLPNHAPLLAALGEGSIDVRSPDGVHSWKIRGGLLEIHANTVSVLADEVIE